MSVLKTVNAKSYLIFIMFFSIFLGLAGCGGGNGNDSISDTSTPTLISTVPDGAAVGVAFNAAISATFSEPMADATISNSTFMLRQGATVVPGTVTYSGVTALFTPSANLLASTVYTATISTGVADLVGNSLATNYIWSFTTGVPPDTTAPTVTRTTPLDNSIGFAINRKILATFNEAMTPATVGASTFTLAQGATNVSGSVTYSGKTAEFIPASNLSTDTTYTATISTGVEDLAGNALAANYIWSFTTGLAVSQGPQPVNLGTSEDYAVLAKTAISTTGVTSIVGDLGVSPSAASYITGFGLIMDPSNEFSTSSLVTGRIYSADYATPTPARMTVAIADMETAFSDAAGRTSPDFTELYAGDVSGQTLSPGLYKWGTGLLITSAGVTLSGSANDVWIFQIAGDITVENSAIVNLIGGAQAKNIFWQTSGQTTLGSAVQMKGIILSQTLISMNTGTVLNGRALAQTGVTMNANTVTAP